MSSETTDKRFKDLQDRLAALQDATNQLQELIDRLASFDFQPGSVPLNQEDNVATELSAEINQILREQEEDLELLLEEIVDVRPGRSGSDLQHDKQRLQDGATRLGQELQSCRTYFRKAQIAAKRNLEAAQRQERELLYASFASPRSGASTPGGGGGDALAPPRRKTYKSSAEPSKEDRIVSASHDVTQSLRQTHDLMASELSRSDFAHRTLKESSKALAELSESYSGLDSLLATSRDLLGTLFRSQKSDTWYLETSFYLLLATIAWLVFRRWLYGPLWWLVWLPVKLLFRGAVSVSGSVGSSQQGPLSSVSPAGTLASSVLQQARMNSEGAPTIQVGQPQATPSSSSSSSQEESMVEEVGKVIDQSQEEEKKEEDGSAEPQADDDNAAAHGSTENQGQGSGGAEGETVLRERRADEPPNPRKRMMEGEAPREEGQDRPKDEL